MRRLTITLLLLFSCSAHAYTRTELIGRYVGTLPDGRSCRFAVLEEASGQTNLEITSFSQQTLHVWNVGKTLDRQISSQSSPIVLEVPKVAWGGAETHLTLELQNGKLSSVEGSQEAFGIEEKINCSFNK